MKTHKLIEPGNVFLDLEADNVQSALTAVAGTFAPSLDLGVDEVVKALLEREALGSTSVGDGFAIPHCKIHGLNRIAIALARLKSGVEFGGDDGTRVSFLFVVLSPPDQPAAHLQVLSQIARVLKRQDLRTELLVAKDQAAVADAICRTADSEGL
jgi:mannitol/fructose-specific phosphotransferase system IIA component (Ntr-type)